MAHCLMKIQLLLEKFCIYGHQRIDGLNRVGWDMNHDKDDGLLICSLADICSEVYFHPRISHHNPENLCKISFTITIPAALRILASALAFWSFISEWRYIDQTLNARQ